MFQLARERAIVHCRLAKLSLAGIVVLTVAGATSGAVPDDILPGRDLATLNRCGPLALQVCAVAAGRPTGSAEIERYLPRNGREWSLFELDACAQQLGLHTLAIKWRDIPPVSEAPAIIPVTRGDVRHFVALVGRRGDELLIVDAPFPPAWISVADLKKRFAWGGDALHVSNGWLPLLELQVHRNALRLLAIGGLAICLYCASRMYRRRPPVRVSETVGALRT